MPRTLDLTGQRFGRLVALRRAARVCGRGFVWDCQCDCGSICRAYANQLRASHIRSCGCLQRDHARAAGSARKLNLTGQRFGRLTVVAEEEPHRQRSRWLCRCDCGNTSVVAVSNLTGGITRSCGCLRSQSGLSTRFQPLAPGIAAFRSVLKQYRESAERRCYVWQLSDNQCAELFSQPCTYCGAPPSRIRSSRTASYTYSGIDRVDNSLGYQPDNVVPCCPTCNRAKDTMSVNDFLNWARRVAAHQYVTGEEGESSWPAARSSG
jgi:hypothetical protein